MTPRTLPISRRQQAMLDRMRDGWTLTVTNAETKLTKAHHAKIKVRPETFAALLCVGRIERTSDGAYRALPFGPDRWRQEVTPRSYAEEKALSQARQRRRGEET